MARKKGSGNFTDFEKGWEISKILLKNCPKKEDVKCILKISPWEWVSTDMDPKIRLKISVIFERYGLKKRYFLQKGELVQL